MFNHIGQRLLGVSHASHTHNVRGENLHFLAVSGCGKIPLASKSCMSHSGAPSVFHVQKIQPSAISNASNCASINRRMLYLSASESPATLPVDLPVQSPTFDDPLSVPSYLAPLFLPFNHLAQSVIPPVHSPEIVFLPVDAICLPKSHAVLT